MIFGEIYEILEKGGFVTRTSWNGVFLWMKQKADVKSEWCKDPILKMLADANGGSVKAEQVICKYDFNEHKVVTGWSPQQDDMAADDWDIARVNFSDEKGLEIKVNLKTKKKTHIEGDLFAGADVIKKP